MDFVLVGVERGGHVTGEVIATATLDLVRNN